MSSFLSVLMALKKITLKKPLIWMPNSCATIINKTSELLYYSLCKITIIFQTFFQNHLWIHHWPALHPSFYQTLAFALWISVVVKNYQEKFPFSEVNQLKSIKTSQEKAFLQVVWFGLWKFNLLPRDMLSYRFYWHSTYFTS